MPSEDAVLRTTTTNCRKGYVKSLDASAKFRAVAIMSHAKVKEKLIMSEKIKFIFYYLFPITLFFF